MTVGDRMKEIAQAKGITSYKISKDGRVSNSYVSDLLNNKRTNPSIEILKRIAKVLDVPVDDLIS